MRQGFFLIQYRNEVNIEHRLKIIHMKRVLRNYVIIVYLKKLSFRKKFEIKLRLL